MRQSFQNVDPVRRRVAGGSTPELPFVAQARGSLWHAAFSNSSAIPKRQQFDRQWTFRVLGTRH